DGVSRKCPIDGIVHGNSSCVLRRRRNRGDIAGVRVESGGGWRKGCHSVCVIHDNGTGYVVSVCLSDRERERISRRGGVNRFRVHRLAEGCGHCGASYNVIAGIYAGGHVRGIVTWA